MKLLLHADVPALGHLGDVVEVPDGYARNYLLPQLLAVKPTEANIKAIAEERARQAELRRLVHDEKVKAAEKVNGAKVVLKVRANEQGHLFGSVGEDDISAALREQGFEVQSRHVVLSEHFRVLGEFEVPIRLADEARAEVQVEVVRAEDQDSDDQSEPS